jgi:hypothetical protein
MTEGSVYILGDFGMVPTEIRGQDEPLDIG